MKITDFGLARAADDASLTRSGMVAGTPMYMAPEQAKGETLDHRADLFSLGSVLYAMCTGRPPFRAEQHAGGAEARGRGQTRGRSARSSRKCPKWLCRIIAKLHAKNPAERFQTAREVADVLADCERQLLAHKELKDFARIPEGKARPRTNGLRLLVSLGIPLLLFAIITFAVLGGPFTILYPSNQGRITLVGPPDPDLEKVLVRRNGELVATLDPANPQVKLPPGDYELEAVCVDGYEATKFHVETRLLLSGGGSFERVEGRPAIRLTLRRGESTTVAATVEKRAVQPSAPDKDGWVQLFNGKDLTGWKGKPGVWVVENGVLVSRIPKDAVPDFAILSTTRRDYQDFHIRMEAKIGPQGASGLTFRMDPMGRAHFIANVITRFPTTGSLTTVDKTMLQRTTDSGIRPDVWFTMEVIARGRRIIIEVDGKEVVDWTDPDPEVGGRAGPIGLLNGTPGTEIAVRKIEIKELPVTLRTPEQLAREETAKLNGEWVVRQASVDQSPLLGSEQTEMKLTLRDGKFILPIRDDSGYSWALTGTYDLDAVKKRLAFKIRGQDDPVPCEYRIERDKLVLDFPEPKNNEGKTGSTLMLAPDERRATQQNLYKLGIAMHNHMGSQTDSLPLPAIAKDGKPLLSWRVALLPHLNQEALYLKFKLDEPWDSEHNKKLIEKMPKVFSIPGLATPPGETHYRVFVGPGTAFEPRPAGAKGIRFADFDDRLSETILVAEAAESVIWTKPDELPYDPKAPLPKLGVYASGPHMVMGDGSVVRLSPQATEKGIRGAIVRNDGEVLSSQMLHRIPLRGPAVHLELHHYTEPVLSPLDREELAKLKGEWLALSAEFEKKPIAPREIDELSIRFGDGEFEFRDAGKPSEGGVGTYRIESEKKHLLLFFKGQTVPVRCPYRVTGDRLGLDFAGLPDDAGAGGKKEHLLRVHERMRSHNNLMQLALAMNNYSNVNAALPPAAIADRKAKDGKPLLSWRVAILPFIEQKELYEQFKLDEPWDSDHNKKLIAKMPKIFAPPGIKTPEPGMTHYRVFVGPGTAFEPRPDREHGFALAEIADGTANTLLIAEAAEPVIWTKPDDLPFDPKKPLPKLGMYERAIHIAYCDGKVVALVPDVSDTVLKGLITRNGGESVSAPVFSPEPPQFPPLYLEFRRADKGGKPAVKEPPNPAVIQPLRDAVAAKTRTLETTKTRYEVGAVSKIDLLNAEAELTDSRVALAEAEGDAATAVARLEELVKQRQEERELIALRVNSGLERSEVLNQADTRVANAKVRLAKAKPAPGAAPAPRPKP